MTETFQTFNTTDGELLLAVSQIESYLWPDDEHPDVCMLRTKSDKTYEISITREKLVKLLDAYYGVK